MTTKFDHFMEQGPYVDYPFEEVMFRYDPDSQTVFAKHYGAEDEYAIGWASNLLNEMLVASAGQRLSKDQYARGKPRIITYVDPATRRRRRQIYTFDQALYLKTDLSCEAYAVVVRLKPHLRSKSPEVDWLTADTQPETSVQTSASEGIHPSAEGFIDPDLEVFWAERGEAIGAAETYELQADLVVKSINHAKIGGGLYIANSTRAVWWDDPDGVALTDDAATLASLPGRILVEGLSAAEIQYQNIGAS